MPKPKNKSVRTWPKEDNILLCGLGCDMMDMYCLRATMIPLVEYITVTNYRCFMNVLHGMQGFL